jgi:hypothetical protein
MPTRKELQRLEQMFGEQLGWNPYHEPLYKWVRAGEPWFPFIKTDGYGNMAYAQKERPVFGDDGEPLYELVLQEPEVIYDDDEGLPLAPDLQPKEEPVYKKVPRTMFVPEPIVEMSRYAAWLDDNQWVLARWFVTPKEEWEATFHGLLPWPHRGLYYPGNGHLPTGEMPDSGNTDYAIQLIQKDRTKTFAEWMNQTEIGLERQERDVDRKLDDMIGDLMTAWGNPRPGQRGGHVSPQGGVGESPILLTGEN